MTSAVAIINPASSAGRTLERLPRIVARLREAFPELVVLATEAPGHATLLCRRALEQGATLVLAVGGDGTNNEILCGFVDEEGRNRFPAAELGIVASGSGSDFQRYLGGGALEERLEAIIAGTAHAVDYGIARFVDREGHSCTRPFLNVVSCGVSGHAVYQVGRSHRLLGATGTYVLGSLRAIAAYRNQPVRLCLDDGPPQTVDLTIAVVANGQYFGGGMWIAPTARCDDQEFEVLWAGGLGRARLVGLLARVFRGKHLGRPGVHHTRAQRVRIEPADPTRVVLVDVDGEQPGRLPLAVDIVPGGLRLRAAWNDSRPEVR